MSTRQPIRLLATVLALFCVTAPPAFAAPQARLWDFWQPSDESSDVRVDHQSWQTLLDRYLVTTGDNRTEFRYGAVSDGDRQLLDRYLAALSALEPRSVARAEQLPYWINLYNATTVRVVLNNPGEDSILRMGGSLFRRGPWQDEVLEISGQALTLDDIEHRILRPIWQDRRIHFAVNCASIGCPNLAPTAFTRDNSDDLMNRTEIDYLTHPRGVEFDADGTLWLSSLFDWYAVDFGDGREEILAYLAKTLRGPQAQLAGKLENFDGPIRYRYDWALNRAE